MGTLSWIFPRGKCPGERPLPQKEGQVSGHVAELSQSADMN